jgi:DNA-binding FrmR family transcriptional regulator
MPLPLCDPGPFERYGHQIYASHHPGEDKALNRVRRIRGQIEAVERALEEEKGCGEVVHIVAAARGAINSLVAQAYLR